MDGPWPVVLKMLFERQSRQAFGAITGWSGSVTIFSCGYNEPISWSAKSDGSMRSLLDSSVVAGDGKSDSNADTGKASRVPNSGEVSAELGGVGRPLSWLAESLVPLFIGRTPTAAGKPGPQPYPTVMSPNTLGLVDRLAVGVAQGLWKETAGLSV